MPPIADLIVHRLRDAGTHGIFGVPGGGGNLDIIESAASAGLPFVLTSTETAAAIAAIAQSEVTGRPGACLTTLGPGAASVVNGVACASLERAPILVLTDSHPLGAHGAHTHQQIDQLALFAAITKWSGRLTDASAGQTIASAFTALQSLPPGPVHIDCPGDVRVLQLPSSDPGGHTSQPQDGIFLNVDRERVRKPLLIVGLGARQPADATAIRQFCEQAGVPAMVTYKAKGVVHDDHPWFAGVFTNGAIERELIGDSDLLIGVGLDPVELLPRPWEFSQPIIGISRWRMDDRHVPFTGQIVGDISVAVTAMASGFGAFEWDNGRVAAHVARQRQAVDIPTSGLSAQRVVNVVADTTPAGCRVTVDAGAHMFPVTMRFPVHSPNGMLISNGLSTMGFALPAAIGAALLDSQPVIALTGDGGLLMCAGELLTAARERLRIVVVVFNDASLSLIEIKQQARRLRPGGVSLGDVRWRELAESFGLASFEARTDDELARAMGEAISVDGPSLIEAKVDRANYGAMLRAIRG